MPALNHQFIPESDCNKSGLIKTTFISIDTCSTFVVAVVDDDVFYFLVSSFYF